jgi:type III secretion system FlhB-like substrate exporter
MKNTYNFTKGKRAAVIPSTGKTRVTLFLDDDVLEAFRLKAGGEGKGIQSMINEALRIEIALKDSRLVTVDLLRQVIREEMAALSAMSSDATDSGVIT